MILVYIFLACFVVSVTHGADDSDIIENEYLAVLKKGITEEEDVDECKEKLEKFGLIINKTFRLGNTIIFYISGSAEDIDKAVELPEIGLVERNARVKANFVPRLPPPWCRKIAAPETWGLDRIDQREMLSSTDPLDILATYQLGPFRGAGVLAYVVDSGIQTSNLDFGNRAVWGYTAINMDGDADLFGHGTHVAGTLGSTSYGVAKEVTLMAVKILNSVGFGTYATVIDGLEWVLGHHNSRKNSGDPPKSVVNLSIGGRVNVCANQAAKELIDAGVVVVAAAGNENGDACESTPASVEEAITVGASNVYDESAFFTNWGPCVDLFAPGEFIKSTFLDDYTLILDGSSMAAPHVAGVVALKLSKEKSMTPAEMTTWILSKSTKNQVYFIDENHATSPNRLLYADCVLY